MLIQLGGAIAVSLATTNETTGYIAKLVGIILAIRAVKTNPLFKNPESIKETLGPEYYEEYQPKKRILG